jgi:rubrerythrin
MFVFGTAEDVFTMAIRIEENGNAFYAGAASRAQDPKVKKLFEELASMEEGHIKAFKALRSTLPDLFASGAVWDPEGLAESYLQASADTHVFTVEAAKSRLERGMTPAQVLDVAIQFEKDSVVFFLGMKELLPDPKGKGEIDRLIMAEMDHIRMLSAAAKNLAQRGSATIS